MGMVLAHQGGWDEMLFVALPLGLFAFLLFIANRKAQAQLDAEERADPKDQTRGNDGD
jgi:predicted MFS family arabinose efflux permease